MHKISVSLVISLLATLQLNCGPSGGSGVDAGFEDCTETADADGDCIPNTVEGCGQEPPRDRDNDGLPDWFDADSDGDGIQDRVEAGECTSPRDTDGDGQPDYLDLDSDNDGVKDAYEDRNGDGVIGSCTDECTDDNGCDAEALETCSLPMDGYGSGVCVGFGCLDGETNPHSQDTDNDGVPDGDEGTFICHPQEEDNPNGLKRIRYVDSADIVYSEADWRIALEVGALDGLPMIDAPNSFESVYTFDMTAPGAEVAGFLVSRADIQGTASEEALWAQTALEANPIFGTVGPVRTRLHSMVSTPCLEPC